jgi:hypothetical protein
LIKIELTRFPWTKYFHAHSVKQCLPIATPQSMSSPEPIGALVSNTSPFLPLLGDLLSYYSFPVIGLGLVEGLLSKHASSDIAIFATARDPAKANALAALQKKHPNKLFIVPYDAGDRQTAKAVAKQIEERFGWVDVVVGNAGFQIQDSGVWEKNCVLIYMRSYSPKWETGRGAN